MLIKDQKIYYELWTVFSYRGFSLKNYKTLAKPSELVLSPLPGHERLVTSLTSPLIVDGRPLGERDMAVIPPGEGASIHIPEGSAVYIAESPSPGGFRGFVKRFSESEVYEVGGPGYRRRVYVTVGEKDPAGSIIAGYVEGERGEWTSYPPHRHDEKPEAYVFFGMGEGFGIQVLMDEEGEEAYVVRDYDVVLIPRGYHPNVCTSLSGCRYLWIISAPPGKRDLGVSIHPSFRGVALGRSHLRLEG